MDWNNDGMDDIIVGDRNGGVHYFRRLVEDDIILVQEDSLAVLARPLDVGNNSAPSVTDWNGDGLPDLVVGRTEGVPGSLYLFENAGSPGDPAFSALDTVRCAGEPIQIYYSYPDFHDMNLDGLDDLVVGAVDGLIWCFLNTGNPGAPLFEEQTCFIQENGDTIRIMGYVRPTIADWNQDGIPDLLIGDSEGFVSWFRGIAPQSASRESTVQNEVTLSVSCNPASGAAGLTISMGHADEPSLYVFSILGRLITESHPGLLPAGMHTLMLDLGNCPKGLYFAICILTTGERASLLMTVL